MIQMYWTMLLRSNKLRFYIVLCFLILTIDFDTTYSQANDLISRMDSMYSRIRLIRISDHSNELLYSRLIP